MEKSEFYCTQCGNKGIPVVRMGNARESGHLKVLYCRFCKKDVNHAEVRLTGSYTYEHFKLEYDNGNFDTEGNRIDPHWRHFIHETIV